MAADKAITTAIKSYGRSGVPLYVLMPAQGKGPVQVLPEIITPGILLEALDRATPP
jgi:thiol:disulfide interchange protein DsbD